MDSGTFFVDGNQTAMKHTRLFILSLLMLATASVNLLAAQRASAAAYVSVSAAVDRPAVAAAAEHEGRFAILQAPAKRCLRGALPGSACGYDLAPPETQAAAAFGLALPPTRPFAAAEARLDGQPPSCLTGPPRSC